MSIKSSLKNKADGIKEKNWYKHLATINEHKIEVGKNCFRCGLYKQGILHDLSKYSWTEFSVGAKYYQGNRSPNEAEREDIGYTSSWLHHKGRNKHHLEYWLDYDLDKRDGSVTGMKMPDNYIVEMFCDRVAASKIYRRENYTDSSALEYYTNGKSKNILHPYTRQKIERLLNLLAERGEDEAFDYAKRYVEGYKKYQKRQKYKDKLKKKYNKKLDDKMEKKREKFEEKYLPDEKDRLALERYERKQKKKYKKKADKKYSKREKKDVRNLKKEKYKEQQKKDSEA